MRRTPILTAAGLTGLLAASCSLPSKEQWAQINQHGLLPVLIDGRETAVASNTTKPSEQHAVRVQAVTTPVVVKTPTASPVPGRTGYAFTPYTSPQKVVDVRGYQPGEAVRCPFTGRSFLVPGTPAAAYSNVAVQRPPHRVTEVVSNDPTIPAIDESLTRLEPAETPSTPPVVIDPLQPAATNPAPAPATATAKPRLQIPYGTRVAGRPGFVYSPFAGKTQLVDVAGTAPGVVVKCPYTNKLFRVPELTGEEIKPAAPAPVADTANTTPPAPADTPAPAPAPDPATPPPTPPPPAPSLGNPPPP